MASHPELGDEYELAPIAGSARRFGYRNHAKLVFRSRRVGQERQTLLGVYRPGTHSVMPADACAVHDRLLQPFLRDLRREVEEREIPLFDERRRAGDLRYALVRSSRLREKLHVTLVSATPDPPWLKPLMSALRQRHASLESAFLCTNPTPGNALLSPDIRRLFGPAALLERMGPHVLESRPDAFLQANPDVANHLYGAARRALRVPEKARLLDLYCGVGAIGLSVARPEDQLLGIESSPSAVACAERNAGRARHRRARFVAGSANDARRLATEHDMASPDAILANPPRKGLGASVVAQMIELGPRQILYVSCDPDTLASDLARLGQGGYRLRRVQAFDMLPQTPHVEALAVVERR